jgi:PAS domain S-box-containing protein
MLIKTPFKSFAPLPDSHFFQDQPFLLEQLWDGVSYGMFMLEILEEGREFRFVAFNTAMVQLSGLPNDYLIGKTLADGLSPERAHVHRQHYQMAVTTAQSLTLEDDFGGENQRWCLTINPLYNPTITHILVTVNQIASRPEASQAEALVVRQILDEVPIILFWKDRNSVYQGCNRFALEVCGLTSTHQIIGKTDYDMPWTEAEADWYRLCDRRVMESGQAEFNIIEPLRQANGQQVILNTNKVPLRDEQGNVTGVLISVEDITARQSAEAALHNFADQQALINRISSQIRNTLDIPTILKTTIQTLSEILAVDWCAFAWYEAAAESSIWHVVQDQSWDGQSWVGRYSAAEIGEMDEAILRLETQRLDRMENYTAIGRPELLLTHGAQSRLCVPIKTQRNQFGVIICDHRQEVHHWTDDEVVLVQSVAGQLAIAVDQADLYSDSRAKGKALQNTLQELKRAQAQMVQSEKMSSLGQLVAGIAHEINNPVNFIHGNVDYTRAYVMDLLRLVEQYQNHYPEAAAEITQTIEAIDLEFLRQDFPKILDSMQMGTVRINEIVESLRSFSRLDETGLKVVDLHKGLESALMILQSRLNHPPAIEVIKNYGDLPLVECLAGEINQVFMNILSNAIDALNDLSLDQPRQIVITTQVMGPERVAIRIMNNGPEIAMEVQHRIFDPFYTTKPVGQGTGMGMAISYQIVTEQHRGRLSCHSERGKGTEFVIELPIAG